MTRQLIIPDTLTSYGAARLVKVRPGVAVDVATQERYVNAVPAWRRAWLDRPLSSEGAHDLAEFAADEYDAKVRWIAATVSQDELDGLPVLWIIAESDAALVEEKMLREAEEVRSEGGRPNTDPSAWERQVDRRVHRGMVPA